MSKQSSIEWLIDNLYLKDSLKWEEILEQAKAMHKEEIMEAHFAPKYGCFSEQYYNEKFNDEQTN